MEEYDPIAAYTKKRNIHPSFLSRTLALLLDISILSLTVFAPVTSLAGKLLPHEYEAISATMASSSALSSLFTYLMLFVFVLVVLYFALLEYLLGQTIGKRVMKLRVVSLDKKPLRFWQAIVRNLVVLPIFPFIIFWLADPLYLLFTKQRLSEQLTKTKTVSDYER